MMHSTLTEKGQTTIPSKIRKALHWRPHQRLWYQIKGNGILLKADESNVLDFYGCLKSRLPPPSKKAMAEVRKAIAQNAAKEGMD